MKTFNEETLLALTIFGDEFEKHGGLRILTMGGILHDEDPVDDFLYYVEGWYRNMDKKQVLAGYTTDEDLIPLIRACYDLRVAYGHKVWIGDALLDYLRGVKGVEDEASIRDRMVAEAEAEAQFRSLAGKKLLQRKLDWYERLNASIPLREKMLDDDRAMRFQLARELAFSA